MANSLTPKLPLHKNTEEDYTSIKEYRELVKQNFKNLMLTVPGERIMDLDFGIGLRRFLFELDTPILYGKISARVSEQVKRYLPYVEILNFQFSSGQTPNSGVPINVLQVSVDYLIKPLESVDKLEITLPGN